MNWINTTAGVGLMAVLTLTGCATQDTILPQADRPMLEIYREAMDEATDEGQVPGVALFDPQAICAALALEEPLEDCQKKLEEQVRAAYHVLDSNASPQSLDYVEYTRTTRAELDNLFPRLENPDLVIYVYPHLATRVRAPIPGYTTVIPLYERVEYRLPGESLLSTPSPNSETEDTAGDTP